MAKQIINLGTAPTGTGGDTPRTAFTKTQANFDELYGALSNATTPPQVLAVLQGAGGYGRSNILGTVSQSGGVPTGAIIEKGSNVNGSYMKFADGTMICWQRLSANAAISTPTNSVAYTTIPSVPMPVTFVDVPTALMYGEDNTGLSWMGCPQSQKNYMWSYGFLIAAGTSSTRTYIFNYIAIGRWF